MIDTEKVKQRGVEIAHVDLFAIVDEAIAEFIGGAVDRPGLIPPPAKNSEKARI